MGPPFAYAQGRQDDGDRALGAFGTRGFAQDDAEKELGKSNGNGAPVKRGRYEGKATAIL